MRCPKCNVEVSDNAQFCYNCGCNFEELKQKQSEDNEVSQVLPVNNISTVKTKFEMLQELDKSLDSRDDFVKYDSEDYLAPKDSKTGIGMAMFLATPLLLAACVDICLAIILYIAGVVMIQSVLSVPTVEAYNYELELNKMRRNIDEHNKQVLEKKFANIYNENGFESVSKKISLRKYSYNEETVLVNDDKKLFGYFAIRFHLKTGAYVQNDIKTCNYSEIIKYEVVDKTTSTQIASSKTSSNVGKAIGGAVVSELITGEAISGAVIGSSGGRKSETTYKTTKKENYDVNIYLNRLNDSIITINTKEREKLSEIISVLEYILQNNMKRNEV